MHTFIDNRTTNTPDELWLVQHQPVFTQGQAGKAEHLLMPGDIPVIQSDRGGQVTYHGPGQQVMYVMVDLKRSNIAVRQLVTVIEDTVINTLAHFRIASCSHPDAPGVYVGAQKICSLGLRIRKGSSFHGLALNVAMDLSPFQRINPCGYTGMQMIQVSALAPHVGIEDIHPILVQQFVHLLGYQTVKLLTETCTIMSKPIQMKRGVKYCNADKMALIPVKMVTTERQEPLYKPDWIKIKLPADSTRIQGVKAAMRKNGLYSVCEEASCPNLSKCFNRGTATFMILGAICTRSCPFCDVAHGRPMIPDSNEPEKLAQTIADMGLRYVVITSVNRDDLRDGGAQHFADCIAVIRAKNPSIKIEMLVPDFRGRMERALEILTKTPPDVFNHNLENVPRVYWQVRPGANYAWSLKLLERFKEAHPHIPTKSGLMVGLGETNAEIIEVMRDLRHHGVTMLTLGQYLQPSRQHLPVQRYVSPTEFDEMKEEAKAMGFTYAACGPLVRSSYHADLQAKGVEVK